MVPWLRLLAALAEDSDLLPSTCIAAHNCPTHVLGDPTPSHRSTSRQNTNAHNIKSDFKRKRKR